MTSHAAFAVATALAMGPAIGPAAAQAPTEEARRLDDALAVLEALTTAPDDGIPQRLLARAEAIVIVPSLLKGGFVLGAKHGKGVISVRQSPDRDWSAPAFLNMTGASIGWQIGIEAVDLVLLVMNREGIDDLLSNRFTIGGSLSLAAGPVGRSADAGTDARLSAGLLAYSRAEGLFAGATLEGAALRADDEANQAFYDGAVDLRTLLTRAETPAAPPAAAAWRIELARLTAAAQAP